METKNELMLRVNGTSITEVSLRHPAIDGHIHSDKYEVEIVDPILGGFALTDDFIIEVKGPRAATKTWQVITLAELITLLSPR